MWNALRTLLPVLLCINLGCGASSPPSGQPPEPVPATPELPASTGELARETEQFVAWFGAQMMPLYAQVSEAYWAAATDVSDRNTGRRIGADSVYSAFIGSPE